MSLVTALRIATRLAELNEDHEERARVVAALSSRMRFLARLWVRSHRASFPPEIYERILRDLDG